MTKVIVLAGSDSSEREISLRSGAAVAKALQKSGYQTEMIDPAANGLLKNEAKVKQADVVFPALHGTGGEDGTIQAQLEEIGVPFVGSDSKASALCFDKWAHRQKLEENGILIPAGELVDTRNFERSNLSKKPFVLKPVDGGSSIDTFIVRDVTQADKAAIGEAFARNAKMLLEELVDGTEITVGILGQTALPAIEIIPPEGAEFDYENKYNGATQELCPPKNVSDDLQKQAQDIALQVHQLCGCRDFSRSDFIVTSNGTIYTLETNTIPGLTDQSLLPKAAAAAGISMEQLCQRLVETALARR